MGDPKTLFPNVLAQGPGPWRGTGPGAQALAGPGARGLGFGPRSETFLETAFLGQGPCERGAASRLSGRVLGLPQPSHAKNWGGAQPLLYLLGPCRA